MNEQQGVRPTERMTYRDSTYSIVSKVAYLIGVPKRIFENQHEPPQLEIFQQLENDKNARIIRHLCIIRTAIERNFKYINDKMRTEYKTILHLRSFSNWALIYFSIPTIGIYFVLDKSLSIAALVQRSFPVGEGILFSDSISTTFPRLAPER